MFLCDIEVAQFAKKKQKEEKQSTLREKIIGRTNAGKAFRVGALVSGAGLGVLALKNKSKLKTLVKDPWETVKNYYTRDADPIVSKTTKTRNIVDNSEKINTKTKVTTTPESQMEIKSKTKTKSGYNPDSDLNVVRTHDKKAGEPGVETTKQTNSYNRNYTDTTDNYTESPDRSFVNTGKKVNWGRVGKTAAIGGGVIALPTGLAYVAGDEQDRKDINNRADKTLRKINKTSKELRTWLNTLHRVSR